MVRQVCALQVFGHLHIEKRLFSGVINHRYESNHQSYLCVKRRYLTTMWSGTDFDLLDIAAVGWIQQALH